MDIIPKLGASPVRDLARISSDALLDTEKMRARFDFAQGRLFVASRPLRITDCGRSDASLLLVPQRCAIPSLSALQYPARLIQPTALADEFVGSGAVEFEHFEVTRYNQLG